MKIYHERGSRRSINKNGSIFYAGFIVNNYKTVIGKAPSFRWSAISSNEKMWVQDCLVILAIDEFSAYQLPFLFFINK